MRADLVYLIQYRGGPHILNLELQTDADSDMAYRMLLYHVELFGKYRLPVISMVMYPFEASIPEPVFREESGQETLLTFHHRVLRLWTIEAEQVCTETRSQYVYAVTCHEGRECFNAVAGN